MARDQNARPLQDANLITAFGGIEETPEFNAEGPAQHDYTYVPGYSDLRYQREVELGQLSRHEIRAKDVTVLPARLHWYRTVAGKGSDPDQMRAYAARRKGYRPVTKADIGQPWLTAMPPGAVMGADGTIRNSGGDLALYVIDQAGAARNAMRVKRATEEAVDGMQMQAGGLAAVAKNHKGADPIVSTKIGQEVTK